MSFTEMDYADKLTFIAEWYEFETALKKNFWIQYYPFDNTVELFDIDKNCIFLRRAKCDGVHLKDMFVGNTVRIYGRQLTIQDYADVRTRKLISKYNEKSLAVFKPTVIKDIGEILNFIIRKNFKIMKIKMFHLNSSQAAELYDSQKSNAFMPFLTEHIMSGSIIAAELIGEDAVNKWRTLIGPKDPAVARKDAPDSLRAIYGQELVSNGFHGSDTEAEVDYEMNFFFPKRGSNKRSPDTTASFKNTTCCIIKPHAVEAGCIGEIISNIMSSNFRIIAMEMFFLNNSNAIEFLEVYKGVVGDFNAMMLSYVDGPCVVMEIGGKPGCDVHAQFREFAGPIDSDVARQIRPYTLRAKFGIDKYKNAIHCTDLPEDTNLELEYFFKILQD